MLCLLHGGHEPDELLSSADGGGITESAQLDDAVSDHRDDPCPLVLLAGEEVARPWEGFRLHQLAPGG